MNNRPAVLIIFLFAVLVIFPSSAEAVQIFFDGFESGSFATNGWTASGTSGLWAVSSSSPYAGSYRAEANNVDAQTFLQANISTARHQNINFSFYARTIGLDSGEYIAADWYNGTAWINLLNVQTIASYTLYSYNLPVAASNKSNFKIRFRCLNNLGNEYCLVDNVRVSGTQMPCTISFDRASSATGTGGLTFSHTVSNYTNRILIVGASGESDAALPAATTCRATAATYGGTALTRAAEYNLDDTGADDCLSMWYLLNPPVGTANVVITYAGTLTESNAGAISIFDAAQQAPEATATNYLLGNPTGITTSIITLTPGAMAVDAVVSGNLGGFSTTQAEQVERYDVGGGGSTSQLAGSTRYLVTHGSANMSWSQPANRFVHVIASFASCTLAERSALELMWLDPNKGEINRKENELTEVPEDAQGPVEFIQSIVGSLFSVFIKN
jgi:hypothetical protein